MSQWVCFMIGLAAGVTLARLESPDSPRLRAVMVVLLLFPMGAPGEPPAQEGGDDAADQSVESQDQPHGGRTVPERDLGLLIMACRSGMAAPLTWTVSGDQRASRPGKRTDQCFGQEPGQERQAKVGAFLSFGSNGGSEFVELG